MEQGPQDGTLLVTWLPVPTNPASTLISPVIGYAVFAAGKKVAEIDSPTGNGDVLKIFTYTLNYNSLTDTKM